MKKVFVGLSGGVDSAVSAHLLKEAGYDVTGVFLRVWEPDFISCTSTQDRLDAMRVAAHIGIPFKTYDFEEEYKKEVVDYFVGAYREGRTPNPDVMCNRSIKFGAFWKQAQADGADYIATGHYAQNIEKESAHALMRGVDPEKDQSYFLWTLTQDDLSHALFPIGGKHKSEVRRVAAQTGLPNASKRDSQGLCFLGHVDMKEFLQHYIPVTKGSVIDEAGNQVAEHDGVWFYTLDQRFPALGGEKMYIVEKRISSNTLVVSSELQTHTKDTYELEKVHWIRDDQNSKKLDAEIRYHATPERCTVSGNSVTFDEPTRVASGQSIVLYDGAECVGGGVVQ